jgi:hypothetical protein
VQPDQHHVGAERLDRVLDRDRALVDLLARDVGDGGGDLGDRDGTEEATAVTGAHLHADRCGLELLLDLAGVVVVANGPRGACLLDRLDGLLPAAGPADRHATGDEVVAAVAVLDLDDVAGGTETVDLLGQNELHRVSPSQRPVDV